MVVRQKWRAGLEDRGLLQDGLLCVVCVYDGDSVCGDERNGVGVLCDLFFYQQMLEMDYQN